MRQRHAHCAAVVWLTCGGLWAQTLSVPPSTAQPGSSGSLLLRFNSPRGLAPVALQWAFGFPEGLTVAIADITPGSAAESAQKQLTCVPAKATGKASRFLCILAGGQNPIPDGPVAVVRYRVPPKTKTVDKVRIENAMASSADTKKVDVTASDGVITLK